MPRTTPNTGNGNGKWAWIVPILLTIIGGLFVATLVQGRSLSTEFHDHEKQPHVTNLDGITTRLDRIDDRLRSIEVGQAKLETRLDELKNE